MAGPPSRSHTPWVEPLGGDWQHYLHHGTRLEFGPRETIYAEGDVANGILYLHQGRVRISLLADDGNEKTLAIQEAGSFLGETSPLDGEPYFANAVAMGPCVLYRFPVTTILELIRQRPEMSLGLFRSLTRKIRMLAREIQDLSFRTAGARVSYLLLDAARVHGLQSPVGTVIPHLTQTDLASLASLSHITVCKIMRRLEQQGVVRTEGRSILLLRPEVLSALSNGTTAAPA